MKKINFISFLFWGVFSAHAETIIQRTIFNADIVASSCHVTVDVDGTGSNRLTFGTFNKSTAVPVSPRDFTVRMYETGATVQGCSAFNAGQVATLQFGNPGQLDTAGVITRGAGNGVRIDVRALDSLADYRGRITINSDEVHYPTDFAAKGEFRFRARPVIPADVKAGEYTGALTFVVSYQ
ncbi:fimbrial protein [Escherichia coli]